MYFFFILENDFLILKTNLDDFLILKKSFSHIRKRIFNIKKKICPFYNNRNSFSYIRKKVSNIKIDFVLLYFTFQYYKISFSIKIN